MKLIDIANKIDKTKLNEDFINVIDFSEEFNYDFYSGSYIEQDRLKCYWVENWICTDTLVGTKMYFLDNEPVAVSMRQARKCDEKFKWFSKDLALKVKNYLISLMKEEEKEIDFEICDLNEDIGEDSYKIYYSSQLDFNKKAMLKGEDIEIIERVNHGYLSNELKIKTHNGEIKVVNIEELDFKFHLAEESE